MPPGPNSGPIPADECIYIVVTILCVASEAFDWDEGNVNHIARHGVTTGEAEEAILDPSAVMLEIQDEEEERVKAVGRTNRRRILVVVFTFRGDAIRPITAYDAM